jgi:hypothetical protein
MLEDDALLLTLSAGFAIHVAHLLIQGRRYGDSQTPIRGTPISGQRDY